MKPSMMLVAILIALLAGLQPSFARCTGPEDYRQAEVLRETAFLRTGFGTLALRYYSDRVLSLQGGGCFDVSKFRFSGLRFELNSTAHDGPAYFAAAVTRTFPSKSTDDGGHELKVRRNASSADRSDKWLRVTDGEEQTEAGIQLNGSEFSVLRSSWDAVVLDEVSDLREADLTDLPGVGSWHAVLGVLDGRRSAQVNIPVVANTRIGINELIRDIDSLVGEQGGPTYTKVYLHKFLTSPHPSLNTPILQPGIAECMYITFGIGGLPDMSLSDSLTTIVLKLDDVDC
jgi:hypothetical protein